MAQTKDNIKASGEAMRGAMNDVKSSNDDVAKIIKTIDEIAIQTNILALNAAVEAARAGESGMGFAVVADEVRNLAQKSAQAARDTAGKIEAAIQKSQRGVQMSDKVAENLASMVEEAKKMEHSLNEIVDKAKEVDGMVGEIATASHEQSQGIEQINKAVAEIDSVTQSTASTAEETASAAEEMRAQAQTLETAVRDLQNIIGGSHEEKKISKIDQASTPLIHTRSSTQKNQHPTAQVRKNSAAKLTLDAINSDTSRNALQLDGDFKDF
jgi:methyl-accepting chemotaxis protein